MRLKLFFSTLAMMLVLFAVAANAQPAQVAATSDAPVQEPLKVSGRMYAEWFKTLSNQSDAGENINTFQLTRVYLDFRKKIDNVWSTRVTLDVGNDNATTPATDSRYTAYIKFAYLQAMNDLGFGRLTMQFGMIGTPVIGLIDDSSDYRWLSSNYLDAAKYLLYKQSNGSFTYGVNAASGQSIDSSADLGASLSLGIGNLVTITAAATNGEGYKKANEMAAGDDGKAYYGMITLTPIQGLSVAAYVRNQSTHDDTESGDNFIRYYGATAVYNFQGIRVGASYIMSDVSTMAAGAAEATVAKYTILDAFLMANLKGLTGIPVLLAGRYAMGTTTLDSGYGASNGFEGTVTIWAVGAGYQFNDSVRVMAYLEDQNSSSDDIVANDFKASNRNFYVKTEARF